VFTTESQRHRGRKPKAKPEFTELAEITEE
jgi:hypothetical protein